jgi:phage terminase large subunit GpA-like protein
MASRNIFRVRARALDALRPPLRLPLSEWIETTLRLPEGVTALPGRVRLWPFQREIANAIGDPAIERVTLVKPVRVGFTTLLSGALASFVANEPAPILAMLPTEADCRDYMVSDLEPIFDATPALRGLLSEEADESGRNTLLSRRFPGGSLKIVAAKSPRNLRRHNARVLLIDEADAMEAGQEGSPITLGERRTLSFANRKIVLGSTPVTEETSNVLRAYKQSDMRVFRVPCPSCGERTEILWKHIEWQPDRPDTAAFRCPICEGLIAEKHKPAMVAAGEWIATAPYVEGHAGFRLNALVSPLANASWGKLAAEFLAAKPHPDQLQTFVNTILAEGWRESAEELDENELAARAEPFGLAAMPPDVLIVTAGIDVQRDRLEIVFLGFGRDTTFVLSNAVIWGSPSDSSTWAELDALLRSQWPHPNGGTLRVDAAAIDAGDGETMDSVLSFTRPRFGRRIVAIKGASGNRPAIKASETKGAKLFIVGVDGVKAQLATRLTRGNSFRFSASLEPRFFEELASERLVIRYRRGAPSRQWERIQGRKAESLDATVYAMAVRGLVSVNLDLREAELCSPGAAPVKASRVIRSAWMGR